MSDLIRFTIDPSLSDQEIADAIEALFDDPVEKHKGPGPHPSGTPQSVHGRGDVSPDSRSDTDLADQRDVPETPFGSHIEILALNEKAIDEDETVYPVDVQEAAADLFQTGLYREAELSTLIATAAPGAKFKKSEYRVKLEPSIRSKIVRNMAELEAAGLPSSVEEGAAMVTDLNRYTILSDGEDFISDFGSIVDALESEGWTSWDHKIKNYFAVGNDSFDGIVSKFRDENGGIVEIQFHTTLSAEKADLSHAIYEVARELPEGDPRRQELAREMVQVWANKDHVPPGVYDIGTPTTQVFKRL